jgi:hypothetical protein
MHRPDVRQLKSQLTLFATRSRQHKTQLRFVGESEELDERVPTIQMRMSDAERLFEMPCVSAQEQRLSGPVGE